MKQLPHVADTQTKLYNAFAKAVVEFDEPLNKITVTEVTKLANLNRRTFYTHLLDIYDLFDKMKALLGEVLEESTASFLTPEGIAKPAVIEKTIKYMSTYTPYILAVSVLDQDFFPKRICELVQDKLTTYVQTRPEKKDVLKDHATDYHIMFISYGLGRECFYWLQDPERISMKSLATSIFYQLSSVTVGMVDPKLIDQFIADSNIFEQQS